MYPAFRVAMVDWVVRGNRELLSNAFTTTYGFYFGDYNAMQITITGADVQGMRVGLNLPVVAADLNNK